jgi:hypothetical protein
MELSFSLRSSRAFRNAIATLANGLSFVPLFASLPFGDT